MGLRDEEKVGTLGNTALKRRERLLALKRGSGRENNNENEATEDTSRHKENPPDADGENLPSSQVLFR